VTQCDNRFSTLDGLRGMAALFVLLFHCGQAAGSGYLGVDLFFLLSGFVLSHSYGDRLRAGMRVARFTALRMVRIYPMFAIGALLGIVLQGGNPTMLLFPRPGLYPANPPLWSLVFEFGVNVAWAAALPWVGARARLAVLVVTGALVAWGAMAHGLGALSGPELFALTTARVAFSYTLGCQFDAMFRRRGGERRTTPLAWLLMPALALVMLPAPANRLLWELAAVFVAIPAIVWLGIVWRPRESAAMDLLGKMSFPLYCIHAPIVLLFLGKPTQLAVAVTLLIPVAIGLGLLDAPLQRALRRMLRLEARPAPRLATA
jgi:peptidoglycan/LPS O-acetylase OafA/YrhL